MPEPTSILKLGFDVRVEQGFVEYQAMFCRSGSDYKQ